jgi:hypothetical protein
MANTNWPDLFLSQHSGKPMPINSKVILLKDAALDNKLNRKYSLK